MCLAQGPQRNDAGEARTRGPSARIKHSTTEPLHSHSSFVQQTWEGLHPQCHISSIKVISLLVLENKILKGLTIFGHGGHLGQVTRTICKPF